VDTEGGEIGRGGGEGGGGELEAEGVVALEGGITVLGISWTALGRGGRWKHGILNGVTLGLEGRCGAYMA